MSEPAAGHVAEPDDHSGCPWAFPFTRVRPLDPPPELFDIQGSTRIERVRIWDGSEPWLVTGYADVRALLNDNRISADSDHPTFPHDSEGVMLRRRRGKTLTNMDGDDHDRRRRMLAQEFTRRRAEDMRGRTGELCDELIRAMREHGPPIDFVEAFALPLPCLVICELLGVPYSERERFERLGATVSSTSSAPEQTQAAMGELFELLAGVVDLRIDEPGDDVMSRVVHEQLIPGNCTKTDLVSMCQILLAAGHETTAGTIALGMCMLLDDPALFATMAAAIDHPPKLATAVEEILRWTDIAHNGRRRVAVEDIEIGGVLVRAGDALILATNVADRDPLVFERPDDIVLERESNHHLAFGFGPHVCLGMSLARVELQVAFKTLLTSFPTMHWHGAEPDVSFRYDSIAYGVDHMLVAW